MDEYESLNHTQWECLYHVVFIPKCRRRTLYVELRKYLGEVFRRLAEQKESRVEEGHLMPDHVHMMLRIPPKYAVSQVVGYIRGRVRSTWRGCMESANVALSVRASGPEGISSRPLVGTNKSSARTSEIKRRKIGGWNSCSC